MEKYFINSLSLSELIKTNSKLYNLCITQIFIKYVLSCTLLKWLAKYVQSKYIKTTQELLNSDN